MRRSLSRVREELFRRRDLYMRKKQRRSAIVTGTGTTILVTCFLLGIIVLPGLLKRPKPIEHTLSESGNFRAFWEAHKDEVIWWEEAFCADSIEAELSGSPDAASTTPASSSPVVLCDNLTDALGSHNGYYAVLPYIGISFDSIQNEIYQGKTLSEWKALADRDPTVEEAVQNPIFREALTTTHQIKMTELFADWGIPYFYHEEHEVYVLFMTEETIRERSTLGYGDITISLLRCSLSFASYELNPDLMTSEKDTSHETEEPPSDSYAMSDAELQAFLDRYYDEIHWSRNRYFVSYSGRIYPYEDYLPGNNQPQYDTFEMSSELYNHLAAGDNIAPYYAVWFRSFETKTSDFTWTITAYLDHHAIPYYTGSATGTHEWKERCVNFTLAFLTLDEIVALYESNSGQDNPFAIMALLPQDIIETVGFDVAGTKAPETESEDILPPNTAKPKA